MSAGSRGSARERQVMAQLHSEGWVVYRSAGSHGCADLAAMKLMETPRLVQVKCSKAGAFHDFGPGEREALIVEAFKAGADAWLCWWPSRKPQRWIPADEWPNARKFRTRVARLITASGGDVEHALRVFQVAS